MQESPCKYCVAQTVCFARRQDILDYRRYSHRIYKGKEFLVRAGDEFEGVYALRSGAAKSVVTIEGGHEQIVHFHFPGELLGSDGFEQQCHVNNVEFLDTSNVCFFSTQQLDELMSESADIRQRILQALSKEISIDHQNILSMSQLSGAQRLARFLLDLSQRFEARGLSANCFELVMTRTDMANYLGLAIETVSRLLKRFQRDGVIKVQRRNVEILSFDLLHENLAQPV